MVSSRRLSQKRMHYAASRRDHGLARQVSLQERVPVTRCRIHSQALQTPNTFCESDRGGGMYHVAQIGTLIPRTIWSFWYRGSTLGMNVRSRAGIWPECDGGLRMKSYPGSRCLGDHLRRQGPGAVHEQVDRAQI